MLQTYASILRSKSRDADHVVLQAYFKANASRENLVVLTGATVTKITFRAGSSPLQATGVEFLNGGQKYHAAVSREVIVSAGESHGQPGEQHRLSDVLQVPSKPLKYLSCPELAIKISSASLESRPSLIFRASERTCVRRIFCALHLPTEVLIFPTEVFFVPISSFA